MCVGCYFKPCRCKWTPRLGVLLLGLSGCNWFPGTPLIEPSPNPTQIPETSTTTTTSTTSTTLPVVYPSPSPIPITQFQKDFFIKVQGKWKDGCGNVVATPAPLDAYYKKQIRHIEFKSEDTVTVSMEFYGDAVCTQILAVLSSHYVQVKAASHSFGIGLVDMDALITSAHLSILDKPTQGVAQFLSLYGYKDWSISQDITGKSPLSGTNPTVKNGQVFFDLLEIGGTGQPLGVFWLGFINSVTDGSTLGKRPVALQVWPFVREN